MTKKDAILALFHKVSLDNSKLIISLKAEFGNN